jgi:hypothetical protein
VDSESLRLTGAPSSIMCKYVLVAQLGYYYYYYTFQWGLFKKKK